MYYVSVVCLLCVSCVSDAGVVYVSSLLSFVLVVCFLHVFFQLCISCVSAACVVSVVCQLRVLFDMGQLCVLCIS